MLLIYNTLTNKKEIFEPINPPDVMMYVCGPTVYDYFHIGNARSFIMTDVVRRYLLYKGYKVKFVMNLTDVDDKIIKRSREQNEDFNEFAEKYITAFFDDLEKLKLMKADIYPKATEHMDDIIRMIESLEDKEFAYWKKAKSGEPYWESRWGKGRPGWHIECSAMSCKHLGKYFDIHAGGNDLIFPHHENEIAQSVAANEKPFVKYWLHGGFLNIENEKMSKSLGNFFTARDVLARHSAEAIRLFFAQAYYRGPLNFSDELLASAEKGLEKFENLVDKINLELNKNQTDGVNPELDIKLFEDKFITAMDDDFNTAQAVAVIFDFVKEVNRTIAENENINADFYKNIKVFLERTAVGVLGIINFDVEDKSANKDIDVNFIQQMIDRRTKAKIEKNYALADKIRNELKELGVELKDSKDGTVFKIVK